MRHILGSSGNKTQEYGARFLIGAVVALQLAHVAVCVFLPNPLIPSNLLQLCFPLLLVGLCLFQRRFSVHEVGARCWLALALAFGIWEVAQFFFLGYLFFPALANTISRVDDALWVFYGLPLLLAINMTNDELDRVSRFDRLQAILFSLVLYMLAFLPGVRLNLTRVFLIQDSALIVGCLLRLPICTLARERRFFLRLLLYLLAYAPMTYLGDFLHARGWARGGPVDLVWSLPFSFFSILILSDALRSQRQTRSSERFVTAVRSLQGVSVALLTVLSIGLSALLAVHSPRLGCAFLVCAFALFALRTNARERAWHHAHGQLEETVLQDALTGLGNRTLLRNSLQDCLAAPPSGRCTMLLFADLDRFKNINDSLGHALGDQLLIQVAERLRAAAPAGAVVCRHGGDEFVMLTSARDNAEAYACGESVLNALRPSYRLGDHVLQCTASLGIVLAAPDQSADELLRTADQAMYRAKQLGKNCVQLFDASMRAQMSDRWELEADLRTCLEQDGIDVAFQPILDVETGEIAGFEALARWNHPRRGPVAPADFIPLAEESGLILTLGAQVLEKACAQVSSWNHIWNQRYTLSVNVSPRQFADVQLLPKVLGTLQRTGLSPKLLQWEITESTFLVHESTVKQILNEARAHGIRISLDDFGTGYSSLAFLLNLPVDEVKVDRSFVSGMHHDEQRRELVRTVVHLGQSLGKRVVAEGVEIEQHLRELAAMGCTCAQGWLISRPLPADELEKHMPFAAAPHLQRVHAAQRTVASVPLGALHFGRALPPRTPVAQPVESLS